MIKEFSRLETWVSKKKISMTERNKENLFIREVQNSVVVNTKDITSAGLLTFHPNEEDRGEHTKELVKYLEENNIELFAISLICGQNYKDLIKPANISLKNFVYNE